MVALDRVGTAERKVNLPAPLFGTYTFMLLGIVAPIWIVVTTSGFGYPTWPLSLATTIIAAARFSWIVASSERRLFELTTWLYFYLFLGIAPLVQLRERFDPNTTPDLPHEHDVTAQIIVLISELALILGSYWGKRHPQRTQPAPSRLVNAKRTTSYSLIILSVSIAYIFIVGPAAMFADRTTRNEIMRAAIADDALSNLLTGFVTLGLLVAVVSQLHLRRTRKLLGEKTPSILLCLSLITLAITVNPVSTPRFLFATVALGIIAAFGVYANITAFRWVAISSVFGMTIVFPLLATFRRTLDATVEVVDPLEALMHGDFDSYGQLLNSVWFVENIGITWGNQLLGVILFWVPRSIWSEKPIDTGALLADSRGYSYTNLSSPLPSELYINGGIVLLIPSLLVLGALLRRWDSRTEISLRKSGVPTVIGCIVPFFMLIALRGSLLNAAAFLSVILVSWFLVSAKSESNRTGCRENFVPVPRRRTVEFR